MVKQKAVVGVACCAKWVTNRIVVEKALDPIRSQARAAAVGCLAHALDLVC
jgi:hypothetical protein